MLLAALTSCPVVLVFALYRGRNRYEVYFEHLVETPAAQTRLTHGDIQALAQRYADRLEHYTRLAPDNWFNFYDFWGDDAGARG